TAGAVDGLPQVGKLPLGTANAARVLLGRLAAVERRWERSRARSIEHAFSNGVFVADVLQPLHTHAHDLQGDAARPAGHADALPEARFGLVAVVCHVPDITLRDVARRQMIKGGVRLPRLTHP